MATGNVPGAAASAANAAAWTTTLNAKEGNAGSGGGGNSSGSGTSHRRSSDGSSDGNGGSGQHYRTSTIGFFGVKSGPGKDAPLAEHYALASYCHSKHEDDGVHFVSAHQHFLYLKAKWAGAPEIAKSVLKERDPMAMKRMTGKSELTIDEGEWRKARLDLMRKAIAAKFRVPQMRERLLATGDAHLEERNGGEMPEESNSGLAFWGTGAYGRGGRGSNWNGKILMEERAAIRKGERD